VEGDSASVIGHAQLVTGLSTVSVTVKVTVSPGWTVWYTGVMLMVKLTTGSFDDDDDGVREAVPLGACSEEVLGVADKAGIDDRDLIASFFWV
jgi:hypothetical protein